VTQLFEDDSEEAAEAARALEVAAAAAARDAELATRVCDLCAAPLVRHMPPYRLHRCRHVLCGACCERALRYHCTCPVCRVPWRQYSERGVGAPPVDEQLAAALATEVAGAEDSDSKHREKPQGRVPPGDSESDEHAAASQAVVAAPGIPQARRGTSCRLVLAIGNTSTSAAGKSSQCTYVRICEGFGAVTGGGGKGGGVDHPIQYVDFNINPSYKKATARVKCGDGGSTRRFELERSLSFTYPCFATVYWGTSLGMLPPLHFEYFTQMAQPSYEVRIVVDVTAAVAAAKAGGAKPRRATSPLQYDAMRGDGWVVFHPHAEAAVTYLWK
jgi:hypothetical protein